MQLSVIENNNERNEMQGLIPKRQNFVRFLSCYFLDSNQLLINKFRVLRQTWFATNLSRFFNICRKNFHLSINVSNKTVIPITDIVI